MGVLKSQVFLRKASRLTTWAPPSSSASGFASASAASLALAGGVLRLELQAELDGRIEEGGDRVIGNQQPLRHAGEGEPDLEGVVADVEVPELVLEHDRHLVRMLLAQALRQAHARRGGPEGDVEMMLAREPVAARLGQDLADDALERVLHHQVVAENILGHRVRVPFPLL